MSQEEQQSSCTPNEEEQVETDQVETSSPEEEEQDEEQEEEQGEEEQVETEPPPSLDEQLLNAAIKGDFAELKLALEKGANAAYNKNIPGVWGAYEEYGPIHKVLAWKNEQDKFEAVELLLKNGASVNAKHGSTNWKGSGSSGTCFELALRSNDPKLIALFLQYGADPNTRQDRQAHTMRYDGSSSYPFLYLSVENGNLDLLKCLLENGANANLFATNRGSSEYGPIDDTKELALHAACKLHKSEPVIAKEMIELLLKYGSDINAYGRSVYQVANQDFPSIEENTEEYYEITNPRGDKYIPKTKNVRITYTPLHMAINDRNEDLYNILLANGAYSSFPYSRNGVSMSTIELMKEKDVDSWKLVFEWTPSLHAFLTPNLKKNIQSLQKCSTLLNWPINIDALSIVYSFVCLEEFFEKDQTFHEFRQLEMEMDSNRSFWSF